MASEETHPTPHTSGTTSMNDHATGTPAATVPAWPFLVARGRHRGYHVILAPGMLIDTRDHGVLDDAVVPSPQEDTPSVLHVTTRSGRPLTIVHATHVVKATDLATPGTPPPPKAPRDEHSRPLQLLYGYLTPGHHLLVPRLEDLTHARRTALTTYRDFLNDEDDFPLTASSSFQIPTPHPPPGTTGHSFAPALRDDRRTPSPYDRRTSPPSAVQPSAPLGTPTRRHILTLYAISGTLAVLALLLYLLVWSHPTPPECPPLPSTAAQRLSPTTPGQDETAPPAPKAQGSGKTSADCTAKDKEDERHQ